LSVISRGEGTAAIIGIMGMDEIYETDHEEISSCQRTLLVIKPFSVITII
jgi:hypothetical protein